MNEQNAKSNMLKMFMPKPGDDKPAEEEKQPETAVKPAETAPAAAEERDEPAAEKSGVGRKPRKKNERKEEYQGYFSKNQIPGLAEDLPENVWVKMTEEDKVFAKRRVKALYREGIVDGYSYSDLFNWYLDNDRDEIIRKYQEQKAKEKEEGKNV